jgi:hypothetical protein
MISVVFLYTVERVHGFTWHGKSNSPEAGKRHLFCTVAGQKQVPVYCFIFLQGGCHGTTKIDLQG